MPAIQPHVLVSSSVFVCRFIAFHLGPLLIYLSYFVTIDLFGFLALVLLNNNSSIRYLDMFFMSTSAATVTGLATVRMESLSSSQMVVLTVLMLLGSEAFVSLLGLAVLALLSSSRIKRRKHAGWPVDNHHDGSRVRSVVAFDEEEANPPPSTEEDSSSSSNNDADQEKKKKQMSCLRRLALVVSAYVAASLLLGSLAVFLYVSNVPSARDVLATKTSKRVGVALFSASVTVSSFANAGLLPTNAGMAAFATHPGLLMLVAGQVLAGGTLFPVFLRLALRAATRGQADELTRFAVKKHAAAAAGFTHNLLMPGTGVHTAFVLATAAALAATAAALLCCLNWDTAVFAGLTAREKLANALFMAVNARQAGENSVDCSLVAPAVLVMFAAMMCTPPSASFFSVQDDGGGEPEERKDDGENEKKRRTRLSLSSTFWSPLALNAAVVMLACVTERRSLSSDPLNFSTFNIVFEVISAYRNVGLSAGYSCSRLLRPEEASACRDQPYSFSGWWSDQGKLLLVLLMLCGRMKGFCRR